MTTQRRHFGLDWLRIAAFGLLIVYHVAMVFSTWDWVIKSPTVYPQIIVPMALLTPWRLPVLFAVSGYASRKLFDKSGSVEGFATARTQRLLVPLAFAMVALIPPEMWIRARLRGYSSGFVHYWASDYWSLSPLYGHAFPSWEHLWFVVYLWAYTVALAGAMRFSGCSAQRLTEASDWLAKKRRLLWAPIALLVALKLAVMFVVPEKQGLFTDWNAHLMYVPIFLFGFALGGQSSLWPAIARARWPALTIALLSGAIVTWVELTFAGHHMPPHGVMAFDRAARLAMAWSMILILLELAEQFFNHDHRWRPTLAEAVFPLYIAHHPAIVLLAWVSLPWGLNPCVEFGMLLTGTLGFATVFYLVGREISWLRPLIGLSRRSDGPPGGAAWPRPMRHRS